MAVRVLSLLLSQAAAQSIYDVPVDGRETVLGCRCKSGSTCRTNILWECNVAEFCEVESKDCDHGTADYSYTLLSYYDYCSYPADTNYEQHTAAQKQAMLLAKLNDGGAGSYPGQVSVLTGILGESVMLSFDSNSDVFPAQRTKYIHSVGIVGGIRFTSTGGHSYKGLFQGAEHGIVRFSSAKEPGSAGFTPGMGVKFLRDGRHSASFVAMYSLDGQTCEENDFFQYDWSNHIRMTDDFGLKIIVAKFWQASYCPLQIGISDLASDADGVLADQGSFPFQLIFKPSVKSDCDCNDYDSCLANLALIPVGTKIFDVQALAEPGSAAQKIGEVVLTHELKRSTWGDEELFFQHQRMEDDFSIHPEWLSKINKKEQCGMEVASAQRPGIDKGCESPFSTAMLNSDAALV